MDLTIDQLAQRVDMSARNIREWQRQGLVAPPTRRGRVGIYSDAHVARITRVKGLHAEGLPLDLIRRLIDTGTGAETDIRHLADEVLDPIAESGSAKASRKELADRLGPDAADGLIAMGLVSVGDDDGVVVRDAVTLSLIEQLADVGISPQRLATALTEVQRLQHEIARLVIDVYRHDVWQPFVSSGLATGDWAALADGVGRAKPLAIQLLARLLDAALDDVAGDVLVNAADEASRALDEPSNGTTAWQAARPPPTSSASPRRPAGR